MSKMKYPCPVCNTPNQLYAEGCWEICEICGWEDDEYQFDFPNDIGTNTICLNEAKEIWARGEELHRRTLEEIKLSDYRENKRLERNPITRSRTQKIYKYDAESGLFGVAGLDGTIYTFMNLNQYLGVSGAKDYWNKLKKHLM